MNGYNNFSSLNDTPAYTSRQLFGDYLFEVMAEAIQEEARNRGIKIKIIHEAVTQIHKQKSYLLITDAHEVFYDT